MAEAALWGAVGASALVVGAEIAFAFQLSRLVVGLIMAFGVGALIAAVSFELIVPAMQEAEGWQVAIGLALGSAVFFLGDRLIAGMGGSTRKDPDAEGGEDSGLGIVLGTVLDGIPESAVLGMSLVGGGGVSIALLVSIWASNFPESLGSSVNMLKSGWSKGKIRLLWWAIVGMSALAAAIGFAIVSNSSTFSGALVEAFAAGALLTMIADEMAPEAYDRSAIYAGLGTVAGFALGVFLTGLE